MDTSAVTAILLQTPRSKGLGRAIHTARARRVSAASVAEAALVVQARSEEEGEAMLDLLHAD
jgi:uncharacterized protein with PIN domain